MFVNNIDKSRDMFSQMNIWEFFVYFVFEPNDFINFGIIINDRMLREHIISTYFGVKFSFFK